MLLHGTDALKEAAAVGHALPGFVAYNLETVQGITAAAEEAGGPVLIQAGSSPFKHAGRDALMRLALDAADTPPPRWVCTSTTAGTWTRSRPAWRRATPPSWSTAPTCRSPRTSP